MDSKSGRLTAVALPGLLLDLDGLLRLLFATANGSNYYADTW
jgi:hypothetical protein